MPKRTSQTGSELFIVDNSDKDERLRTAAERLKMLDLAGLASPTSHRRYTP